MEISRNARIKRYPDGSAEILIGSMPFGGGNISRPRKEPDGLRPDWRGLPVDVLREMEYAALERESIRYEDVCDENAALCKSASLQRSVRRAKKVVQDLARSNEWTYFVTLTLDPEKVNRYDPVEILKHLRHWLGNNVRRRGLRYVLVPEHHKDGAIHFHGLFNDALDAVDSGTMSVPGRKAPVKVRSEAHRRALERDGAHAVYNLPGWGWGFSTAIMLYGERDAAINYVCKYIGKEIGANVRNAQGNVNFTGKIGGRWYYSGGDLLRPSVEWFDVDIRDWENVPGWYSPDALPGVRFLTLRVSSGGEILDPYVRPVPENAKRGSARNPAVPAGRDSAPDVCAQWVERVGHGDFDGRGASYGLSAEAVDVLQACPTEEAYDAAVWAILYSENPSLKIIVPHLTKSGLSIHGQSLGVEGVEPPPGQNGT